MLKLKRLFLSSLIVLILTFLACPIASEAKNKKPKRVEKSGVLTKNETWSGVINVTGDVVVPAGLNLKIRPGTKIIFPEEYGDFDVDLPLRRLTKQYMCNIIIEGTLNATGTKNAKIHFGSKNGEKDKGFQWAGIYINSKSKSVFKHCVIENAIFGITLTSSNASDIDSCDVNNCSIGIYSNQNSSPQISTSVFRKCATGIDSTGEATPTITYNFITDNDWGVSYGGTSAPKITFNTITKNDLGVGCYGKNGAKIEKNKILKNKIGIKLFSGSTPVIKKNKINNNEVGIEHQAGVSPTIKDNELSGNETPILRKK